MRAAAYWWNRCHLQLPYYLHWFLLQRVSKNSVNENSITFVKSVMLVFILSVILTAFFTYQNRVIFFQSHVRIRNENIVKQWNVKHSFHVLCGTHFHRIPITYGIDGKFHQGHTRCTWWLVSYSYRCGIVQFLYSELIDALTMLTAALSNTINIRRTVVF